MLFVGCEIGGVWSVLGEWTVMSRSDSRATATLWIIDNHSDVKTERRSVTHMYAGRRAREGSHARTDVTDTRKSAC